MCRSGSTGEREREGGSKRPPKVTLAAHCAALPLYIVPDVSGIRIENRYGRTRGTSVRSSLPLSNGRSAFALASLDVRLVELVLNLPLCNAPLNTSRSNCTSQESQFSHLSVLALFARLPPPISDL